MVCLMAAKLTFALFAIFSGLVSTEAPVTRRLAAGYISSAVEKRESSFQVANEADFHFVQQTLHPASGLGARLSVKSKLPILVLEDVESSIESVRCSESVIELLFISADSVDILEDEIVQLSEFILVTAHDGCNEDGERTPYVVSGTSFDDDLTVSLQVSRLDWHEAFYATNVNFGSGDGWSHIQLRDQKELRRRQETQSATYAATTSQASLTTTFPFSTPPTSASLVSVNEPIHTQILNKVIMPPQIPVVNQLIPLGLTQSCKNCTLSGSVEVSRGSFAITNSDSDDVTQDINSTVQFFEHGSLEIVAHNLFAHIELETQLQPSAQRTPFRVYLPSISLSPIEIPGVAVLGPLISPQISAQITFTGSIDFSYGFEVSVPDGSTFTINMTDIGSSTMKGFDKSTVHALPLSAGIPIPSLIFSLSLTPQFLIGLSLPGGTASGGVGAFLDLPQLSVNITELTGVNKDCENLESTISSDLHKLLGNLTNVVPSVDLNIGAIGDFDVEIDNFGWEQAKSLTLASTAFTLPTACLSFDSHKATYAVASLATSASSSASATAGAGGKKKSAGVKALGNPLGEAIGGAPWSWIVTGIFSLVLWL